MKDWFEKFCENVEDWRLFALLFLFLITMPIFGEVAVAEYFIKVMQRAFELGDEWRFVLWVLYAVLWIVVFVKFGFLKETEDQKWQREQKQKEWDEIIQNKKRIDNLIKQAQEHEQKNDIDSSSI